MQVNLFSWSSQRREVREKREGERGCRQKYRQAQRKNAKLSVKKNIREWLSGSLSDSSDRADHGLVMKSRGR